MPHRPLPSDSHGAPGRTNMIDPTVDSPGLPGPIPANTDVEMGGKSPGRPAVDWPNLPDSPQVSQERIHGEDRTAVHQRTHRLAQSFF